MKDFSGSVSDTQILCAHILALSQQNPLVAAIAAQGTEVVEMLLRKNLDYRSSVFSSPILSSDLTPEKALKVRMSDKIARMQSLDQSGKAHIASESYSDTVRDLAGYCILWLAVLASKQPGETFVAGKASPSAGETGNVQPKRDLEWYKAGLTDAQKMALDPPTAEAGQNCLVCGHQGTVRSSWDDTTQVLSYYCNHCDHAWRKIGPVTTRSSSSEGKASPTATATTPTEPVPLPAPFNDFILNPGLAAAWIEERQRDTLARPTAAATSGNDQTRVTSMAFAEGWDAAMEYLVFQLIPDDDSQSL